MSLLAQATRLRAHGKCAARQPMSDLPVDHRLFQLGDFFRRVETLRAGFGAIQDRVTAIKPERILKTVEARPGAFVPAVLNPAVRMPQRGRSKVSIGIPPITRAGCRAASAQNAFVHAVEFGAVVMTLLPFLLGGRRRRL